MGNETGAERPASTEIRRRIAVGAGWMVAMRWGDRLVGLASIALLARLLGPEDFGIVGYAVLLIGLLEIATALSTDTALIRDRSGGTDHYDAAWTLNILRGLAVGALVALAAVPAASFFGDPRLVLVMLLLAIGPIVDGFENVGVVAFRTSLEFDREFRFRMVSRLIGTGAAVVLALMMRDYHALVLGTLLRKVVHVGLSFLMHPFRPRIRFERVTEIFRFSRWMMLQNLVHGLGARLPALVLGREHGSGPLAFFSVAQELAALATTEIRAPIRRALLPGLVHEGTDRQRLQAALVEATGVMALLTLPIPLGIALVAADLVPLVLGARWTDAVDVLQVLGLAAALGTLGSSSHLGYLVIGRASLAAAGAVGQLLVVAPLLYVFVPSRGPVGAAMAVASATAVALIVDYAVARRVLGLDLRALAMVVYRPVIAAGGMWVAVSWLRGLMPVGHDPAGHFASLALSAVVGAVVYVLGLGLLWWGAGRAAGPERLVLSMMRWRGSRPSEVPGRN